MKLRNKKTGEIIAPTEYTISICNGGIKCRGHIYYSLAELNEDWEDYKPAEPYIKDEKIRKFVRDWAEMNSISEIIVFDQANSPYIPAGQVVFAENAGSLRVCFRTDEKFDTNKIYTITELCGEEKNNE